MNLKKKENNQNLKKSNNKRNILKIQNKLEIVTKKNEGKKSAFYFETDSKHYKVEAKKYVKDLRKSEQHNATDDEIFWCKRKPTSYEDANKDHLCSGPYQLDNLQAEHWPA